MNLRDTTPGAVVTKIGRYTFLSVLLGFFALPMLWLASAPFNAHPTLNVSISSFTLHNFSVLLKDPYALPSLWNSLLLAGGTALLTVGFAAAAAYALSRVRVPGRDGILY